MIYVTKGEMKHMCGNESIHFEMAKCQKFLMLIFSVNVKINIKKFGDNYYNASDFISHN